MDLLVSSNENSAMLATLESASNANTLPFNYSLEKNIQSHGLLWTEISPQANADWSKSTDFDIPKYGYLRSLYLKIKLTSNATMTASNKGLKCGALGLINNIELLSSGRRLHFMSSEALRCAISNLNGEDRQACVDGCFIGNHSTMAYTAAANGNAEVTSERIFYVPILLSCFNNIRNISNTRFEEAHRLRISWTDGKVFWNGSNALASATFDSCSLVCEFKRPRQRDDDSIVSLDYGSGQPLSKVYYEYEDEVEQSITLSKDNTVTETIDVKTNSAIANLFVTVVAPNDGADSDLATNSAQPVKLDKIQFKGSGMDIVNLDAELIRLYGHRTLGRGFYGRYAPESEVDKMCYVYKIQLGLDNNDKYFSNLASLREVNNPQVVVTVSQVSTASKLDGKVAKIHITTQKAHIISTDPNTGKQSISLSN